MNPEASAAIRRAEEFNRERQDRDFRREQLKQGALQARYKELKAEIQNLEDYLKRILGYRNLQVKDEGDSFEFRTERAKMRLLLFRDRIGVHSRDEQKPEKTYSIYYTMPSQNAHRPEWRASEREKGYTSEQLADELMLELLQEDYSAERALERALEG